MPNHLPHLSARSRLFVCAKKRSVRIGDLRWLDGRHAFHLRKCALARVAESDLLFDGFWSTACHDFLYGYCMIYVPLIANYSGRQRLRGLLSTDRRVLLSRHKSNTSLRWLGLQLRAWNSCLCNGRGFCVAGDERRSNPDIFCIANHYQSACCTIGRRV